MQPGWPPIHDLPSCLLSVGITGVCYQPQFPMKEGYDIIISLILNVFACSVMYKLEGYNIIQKIKIRVPKVIQMKISIKEVEKGIPRWRLEVGSRK
jgi:hypothetical protein